jgi:hypothetical protein
LKAVARAPGGRSAAVSLCFAALDERDVAALARALEGDARVRALNVAGNAAAGPGGARALAALLLRNSALTSLNAAASALAAALADNIAREADATSRKEVGSRAAAALASALETIAALEEQWLEGNAIEVDGAGRARWPRRWRGTARWPASGWAGTGSGRTALARSQQRSTTTARSPRCGLATASSSRGSSRRTCLTAFGSTTWRVPRLRGPSRRPRASGPAVAHGCSPALPLPRPSSPTSSARAPRRAGL